MISRPAADDPRLSFTNLIEAHVLRALRTVHEVRLNAIREATGIAEQEFGIRRLLISPDLSTSAGQLFLDRYTHLLELNPGRQLAMRSVLEQFLARVTFDEAKLPFEFRPSSAVRGTGGHLRLGTAVPRKGHAIHALVR